MLRAFQDWRSRTTGIPRRAFGAVAAILVHVIGFLLAFLMGPITIKPKPEIQNFQLMSLTAEKVAAKPTPRATSPKKQAERKPPPVETTAEPAPLAMMLVSRDVFAASDISKIQNRSSEVAASASANTGDQASAGDGPNGERMYNADWYREPTHAEMATYFPKGVSRSGWGMIACRTVENFRVEDCQELAEWPAGSGIARGLRQAAWQFRVRPPRLGGKPLIGAWVRIRFDLTVGVVK